MNPVIERCRPQLETLCRRYRVRRLELFGSALGDRFDSARSDLDFVVEFDPPTELDLFDQYIGFLLDCEALFGRKVDLVEARAIRNARFRDAIDRAKVLLYAA